MHRYATCLRSCRRLRLNRGSYRFNCRPLSAIVSKTDPSTSKAGLSKARSNTRLVKKKLEEERRVEDDRDVFVDDLSATLEAHRARNRASVIRKIEASPSLLIHRPLLEGNVEDGREGERPRVAKDEAIIASSCQAANTLGLDQVDRSTANDKDSVAATNRREIGSSVQDTQRSKVKSVRWPADSVQAQKGAGRRRRRGYTSSTDILEYTGVYLYPERPWKNISSRPSDLQRPWLLYMKDDDTTYPDRFVRCKELDCTSG